ncbi:MAG: hypothetical protein ACI9K2_001819 [Myxococcota bacterium]|jgi:hypothetical protein
MWTLLGLLVACGGVAKIGVDTFDTAALSTSPTGTWGGTASGGGTGAGGTGGTGGGGGTSGTGGGGSATGTGTGTATGGAATGGSGTGGTGTGTGGTPLDRDGDGVPAPEDCDDSDPSVYPGAEERCDGIDQDCDGMIVPGGDVCPCPLVQEAGLIWLACEREKSWEDAEDVCASVGFHLPWVSSRDQNDVVRDLADAAFGRGSTWLGLNDRSREGDFEWSSGVPVSWDNWGWGEPNDVGNEDCGELTRSGEWNDVACRNEYAFLCRLP